MGCFSCLSPTTKGPYTLKYFGIPALGEPIRILCTLGDIPFKDERITFPEWDSMKASTRWGQLPVLITPAGKEMTQSLPIFYFLAKQVKVNGKFLYPKDPMKAFEAQEMISAFEDMRMKLVPTFRIRDQSEKEAFRANLFKEDGDCTAILKKFESFAGAKYLVTDAMTIADVWAFFFLNFLRCGFWDGLPTDYLDKYPKLFAICNRVASLPKLKSYYAHMAQQDAKYKCFLPEN